MVDQKRQKTVQRAKRVEKPTAKVSDLFKMFAAIKDRQIENGIKYTGVLTPVIQEISGLLGSCETEMTISANSATILIADQRIKKSVQCVRGEENQKIKASDLFKIFAEIKDQQVKNNLKNTDSLAPAIQEISRLLNSCETEITISVDSANILMAGAEFMRKADML